VPTRMIRRPGYNVGTHYVPTLRNYVSPQAHERRYEKLAVSTFFSGEDNFF